MHTHTTTLGILFNEHTKEVCLLTIDVSRDALKAQQAAVNGDTLSYDALDASLMLPPLQLLRNA